MIGWVAWYVFWVFALTVACVKGTWVDIAFFSIPVWAPPLAWWKDCVDV